MLRLGALFVGNRNVLFFQSTRIALSSRSTDWKMHRLRGLHKSLSSKHHQCWLKASQCGSTTVRTRLGLPVMYVPQGAINGEIVACTKRYHNPSVKLSDMLRKK